MQTSQKYEDFRRFFLINYPCRQDHMMYTNNMPMASGCVGQVIFLWDGWRWGEVTGIEYQYGANKYQIAIKE